MRRSDIAKAAKLINLLNAPYRSQILELLGKSRMRPKDMLKVMNVDNDNLHYHLRVLKKVKAIRSVPVGADVYYYVNAAFYKKMEAAIKAFNKTI